MLRMLRQQVSAVIDGIPVRRKPALRRSDAPDALLATDLPFAAEESDAAAFVEQIEALGWRVRQAENGWLLLDAPVPVPQTTACIPAAGELACCISLLLRHPEDGDASDMIRAVAKAAEAGRQPFERLCVQLHGQLAAMLRLRQPLPASLLPYLYHAQHELYE